MNGSALNVMSVVDHTHQLNRRVFISSGILWIENPTGNSQSLCCPGQDWNQRDILVTMIYYESYDCVYALCYDSCLIRYVFCSMIKDVDHQFLVLHLESGKQNLIIQMILGLRVGQVCLWFKRCDQWYQRGVRIWRRWLDREKVE